MSDDRSKPVGSDRTDINIQDHVLQHCSAKFGVTSEELKPVVTKVDLSAQISRTTS